MVGGGGGARGQAGPGLVSARFARAWGGNGVVGWVGGNDPGPFFHLRDRIK